MLLQQFVFQKLAHPLYLCKNVLAHPQGSFLQL